MKMIATRYEVVLSAAELRKMKAGHDLRDIRIERPSLVANCWVISLVSWFYTKQGKWELARLPSAQTAAFKRRTRWTLAEAQKQVAAIIERGTLE